MRIGIDIDDVITDTSIAMKAYIDKYDSNSDIYYYIEDIMRGDIPTEEVRKFFEDNCINIFRKTKVKENASKVIQYWLDLKNEIFIITSRGEERMKNSEKLTLQFLKNNNINYTKIIFNSFDKAKICKENKIDIMIDDSVKYCEEIANEKIKSILFTSIINKNIKTAISRVNNWIELKDEVNKISN